MDLRRNRVEIDRNVRLVLAHLTRVAVVTRSVENKYRLLINVTGALAVKHGWLGIQEKFHWSLAQIFSSIRAEHASDRARVAYTSRLYARGTKRSLYTASFYVHRKNAKQACTSAHTSAHTCTRDSHAARGVPLPRNLEGVVYPPSPRSPRYQLAPILSTKANFLGYAAIRHSVFLPRL